MTNEELRDYADKIHNCITALVEKYKIPYNDSYVLELHAIDSELALPGIVENMPKIDKEEGSE